MKNLKITLTINLTLVLTLTLSQDAYCMQKTYTPNFIRALKEEAKKDIRDIQKKDDHTYTIKQMKSIKTNALKKNSLNVTANALLALKDSSKIVAENNGEISTRDLLEVLLINKIFIKFKAGSKDPSIFKITYRTKKGVVKHVSFLDPYSKKIIDPGVIENIKLIASKMLLLKDLQEIDQTKLQSPDLNINENLKKLDLEKH